MDSLMRELQEQICHNKPVLTRNAVSYDALQVRTVYECQVGRNMPASFQDEPDPMLVVT